MFNDLNKSFLQYFKVISILAFVCVVILIQILMKIKFSSVKFYFSFLLINSFYTLLSKFFILFLICLLLIVSKYKFLKNSKLACILELPTILVFSILFLSLLTNTNDFFIIYLCIEGLSLTLYVLSSILYRGVVSIEASLKYFSLGIISSGFFLFGASMLFGCVGSLNFLDIQIFLGSSLFLKSFVEIKISLLFIIFSMLFKIAAFPCHIWVADVYEGIWTPITAIFAIVIKVGFLLIFIRLLFNVLFNVLFFFQPLFIVISAGSITIGLLGAFKQLRLKRFIAYTSINQIGFIFLGIASCNLTGLIASILFIIIYALMSLAFFTLILNSSHIITGKSIFYLSDLYCFCLYNIEIAFHFVLLILSMASLPPLLTFISKLFLYMAIIEARLDFLLLYSLISSIISIYYYLSFIRYLFFENYNILKFFYFKKNFINVFLLRIITLILIFWWCYLNTIIKFVTNLALSCAWPLVNF